jgi:hypothetical protein
MRLTEAQIARVHALEDARGVVTADQVVEEAKNKRSPLHALFEWNLSKAAALQWVSRAREIIGAVEVVVVNETTTVRSPFYMRDTSLGGDQGYRAVSSLRADPEQARESLIFTLTVASGHLKRAYDLAEPLGLTREIDALLEQVAGVQRAIRTAA